MPKSFGKGQSMRNMDLIRLILFEIDKQPPWSGPIDLDMANYSSEVVSYHVMLLEEASLLQAHRIKRGDSTHVEYWRPIRLTWQGYEFLEVIKDETRWNKVKQIMEKVGGFAYEIAKPIAIDLVKKQISSLSQI